jgi:hypothetical protein
MHVTGTSLFLPPAKDAMAAIHRDKDTRVAMTVFVLSWFDSYTLFYHWAKINNTYSILTYLLTYLLTYSLTHSLTHSMVQDII